MRTLITISTVLCLTHTVSAVEIQSLSLESNQGKKTIILAGRDASRQLIVTGKSGSGELLDLTDKVKYQANPNDIVQITDTGFVTPLMEGKVTILAQATNGPSASVSIHVKNIAKDVPVNFPNQIVPIFTRYGCNAGGCHGKADGQNGFKLSLLGFEPTEDYEYIVKEARGRRILPSAPAHSLLLTKATGRAAHGGGKRLEVDSPYYRLLKRWIAQGSPYGQSNDPTVTKIEVIPHERIMQRNSQQQLAVLAHMSDGSVRDVTRLTQFEANETEMAKTSDTGLVTTQNLPGSVAVMARFQSHVDVFRATIPLGVEVINLPKANNFIDELVFKQLKKLGLPPSQLASDSDFLRRVTIDICGRLPTLDETKQFLTETDEKKYEKLIDRLLASKDYADYFANKWSAILRNRRKSEKDDPKPTAAFHQWIREKLHANKPFDEIVRGLLTASGEEIKNPPVIWYREVREANDQIEDIAQLFLGQRIQCARCHHHPFEKWSQQDYYGMAAFFSRLEIKDPPPPKKKKRKKGEPAPKKPPFTVNHKVGRAQAINPKTKSAVQPTGLGSSPLKLADKEDPRNELVKWMIEKQNPFFAKTLVNRYWKHFFGRGLVDPEDDMRVTNPSTNPELLNALAESFTKSNYNLKALVKTICMSNVYRLSSQPNEHNVNDRQSFSRFLPRRLNAEVLLDSIDDLTLAKTSFKGLPKDTRAIQLPDNQFSSYFLSVFGRPDSASACECERSTDATLAQTLHLLNSPDILKKVTGPRASNFAKDKKRNHEEKVREIYLLAFSRQPSQSELELVFNHIQQRGNVQEAYQDLLWVLINTKEFLFNH